MATDNTDPMSDHVQEFERLVEAASRFRPPTSMQRPASNQPATSATANQGPTSTTATQRPTSNQPPMSATTSERPHNHRNNQGTAQQTQPSTQKDDTAGSQNAGAHWLSRWNPQSSRDATNDTENGDAPKKQFESGLIHSRWNIPDDNTSNTKQGPSQSNPMNPKAQAFRPDQKAGKAWLSQWNPESSRSATDNLQNGDGPKKPVGGGLGASRWATPENTAASTSKVHEAQAGPSSQRSQTAGQNQHA